MSNVATAHPIAAELQGITIKINEPIEVKVEVTSKIAGFVDMQLYEPGVTKSFEVISA